ncbi:Uncharacterised protein [Candidatus Tiddalikarchaeum anstoanum]|nr:Uncharacterised protein [Candidatus Tiddalikarchaeum anstoanum]
MKLHESCFLIFLLIAGCTVIEVESSVIAGLGTDFQLGIGQMGIIESENLSVIFLNVSEDSRCPISVECIQAGRVMADFSIITNSSVMNFTLILNSNGSDSVETIGNYSIKLVEVVPTRLPDHYIRPEDYLATLLITKE